MKILNVTPYYAPEGGGLERYAHAILSRLAARGHDVEAVALARNGGGSETRDGVPLTRLRATLRVSNTPIHPRLPTLLLERMRQTRPDVVVAHAPVPFAAECAGWAAHRAGIPYVAAYHAGALTGSGPVTRALAFAIRNTTEAALFSGARALVTVSPLVRDRYLAAWSAKTTVIRPGVDARFVLPDTTHAERDGDARGEKAPLVLFVGSLDAAHHWKGFHILYDAVVRARRALPNLRLIAVGDGDERGWWMARARADELHEAFAFPGRVSDEILARLYRAATCLALPSLTDAEACGMVTLEANACGTAVVASRVGGVPAFIEDERNGLLVDPGDRGMLAEAIVRLATEDGLARRLGAAGRERVKREHAWDTAADAWESLLAEIASGGRDALGIDAPTPASVPHG